MDFFFNMQLVQTIILNGKVYYIKLASNIHYFANDNVIVFLAI